MDEAFSLTNKTGIKLTKSALPAGRQAFLFAKNDILGKKYILSIALVDEKTSHQINKTYRKKDKPTNVLSFPITKNSGELVLCLNLIKKESTDPEKNFGKKFPELLLFLVIHGMLHLKGMQHGAIMERREKFYCKKYDKKHFDRNRRGLNDDKGRSGRVSKR